MQEIDELELLKIIDTIPKRPERIITIVKDGYVEVPQNVRDYLEQLGVVPELESNGKMSLDDFDSLAYQYGVRLQLNLDFSLESI